MLVDPTARPCLDLLQCLGNRDLRRQRDQPVHVVWYTVEQNRITLDVAGNPGEVRIQIVLHLAIDERLAVLGAEYDVHQQIGMGLGHASSRPYRAGEFYTTETQGWRPGLAFLPSLRDGNTTIPR